MPPYLAYSGEPTASSMLGYILHNITNDLDIPLEALKTLGATEEDKQEFKTRIQEEGVIQLPSGKDKVKHDEL